MADPFVSVIMPFYEASTYLSESIDSVLSQSYDNFELVLIDDGSRDGSRAIASSFLSKDVSLLCQSNQGVGAAFNAGVRLARGDHILLHGADDVSHPDRLRRSVDQLRSGMADVVTCRPDLIDGGGDPIARAAFPVFDRDCDVGEPFAVFTSLFFLENFICAPAAAVSRSSLAQVGAVHAGLIQLQDFDYWLRAAALGARFHIDPDPWLSYRRHAGNLSHLSNLPRSQRETALVYRRLAPLITVEVALHLLAFNAPEAVEVERLGAAPACVLTPLAYVAHRNPGVRQIGYEMLMDLLSTRGGAPLVERCTGLSPGRLFEMIGAQP